jgi:hypothetical protein
MIIKNNKKVVTNVLVLLTLVTCCFSCDTDLYETYDEFAVDNVVSIAVPDSLATVQGNGKLLFKVFLNADPKIKKGVISWNQGAGNKTFAIARTIYQFETIEVEIELEEGPYDFSVYLEDAAGNKSKTVSYAAKVLGENYRASLKNRSIKNVRLYSETEAVIYWRTNINPLLVETELIYTDSPDGLEKTIVIDASVDTTIVPDFQSEGTFSYKTVHKASLGSTDTFVTIVKEGTFPIALMNRRITDVGLNSDDEAVISWEPNTDDKLVKTELIYTDDPDGHEKTIVIEASEDMTIVPDFQSEGTFSYKTVFKASVDSTDTFLETYITEGIFPIKP